MINLILIRLIISMLILTKFNLTHDHFGFDQIYLFRSDQYCFNLDKFDLTQLVFKSSILIIITLVFIRSIYPVWSSIKFYYDKFDHVYFNYIQFDNDNNPCLCINFSLKIWFILQWLKIIKVIKSNWINFLKTVLVSPWLFLLMLESKFYWFPAGSLLSWVGWLQRICGGGCSGYVGWVGGESKIKLTQFHFNWNCLFELSLAIAKKVKPKKCC